MGGLSALGLYFSSTCSVPFSLNCSQGAPKEAAFGLTPQNRRGFSSHADGEHFIRQRPEAAATWDLIEPVAVELSRLGCDRQSFTRQGEFTHRN